MAVAVLLAGCGIGAGPGTKQASVRVTANFGRTLYGSAAERHVPGAETVMSLLERHFKVATRYGGGFVESIDGHSGSSEPPRLVLLRQRHPGAAGCRRDRRAQGRPHLVGPPRLERHRHGSRGRRFLSRAVHQRHRRQGVPDASELRRRPCRAACNAVGTALHRYGVKAADQVLGTGSGSDSLAVVVGTWNEIKGVIAAQLIAAGPRDSGVYARFVGPAGRRSS